MGSQARVGSCGLFDTRLLFFETSAKTGQVCHYNLPRMYPLCLRQWPNTFWSNSVPNGKRQSVMTESTS